MNLKQISSFLLLVGSLLLTGCSESPRTNPPPKQDPIIGVWRGASQDEFVLELTITRIDAGLICMDRVWPKDSSQGMAGEIKYPLRKTAMEAWEGEYHGQVGFRFNDFTTIFQMIGNELHEHRLTIVDHDKKWDERWTYHRYSP